MRIESVNQSGVSGEIKTNCADVNHGLKLYPVPLKIEWSQKTWDALQSRSIKPRVSPVPFEGGSATKHFFSFKLILPVSPN
jgi:hypothetical protein